METRERENACMNTLQRILQMSRMDRGRRSGGVLATTQGAQQAQARREQEASSRQRDRCGLQRPGAVAEIGEGLVGVEVGSERAAGSAAEVEQRRGAEI